MQEEICYYLIFWKFHPSLIKDQNSNNQWIILHPYPVVTDYELVIGGEAVFDTVLLRERISNILVIQEVWFIKLKT